MTVTFFLSFLSIASPVPLSFSRARHTSIQPTLPAAHPSRYRTFLSPASIQYLQTTLEPLGLASLNSISYCRSRAVAKLKLCSGAARHGPGFPPEQVSIQCLGSVPRPMSCRDASSSTQTSLPARKAAVTLEVSQGQSLGTGSLSGSWSGVPVRFGLRGETRGGLLALYLATVRAVSMDMDNERRQYLVLGAAPNLNSQHQSRSRRINSKPGPESRVQNRGSRLTTETTRLDSSRLDSTRFNSTRLGWAGLNLALRGLATSLHSSPDQLSPGCRAAHPTRDSSPTVCRS